MNSYFKQLSKPSVDTNQAGGHSRFGDWRSFTTDNTHDVGNAYLLMVTNASGTYLQIRLI